MVKVHSLLTYTGISLLGSSVALNFFLYGQLQKYYIELSQVRLDPLGLSFYTQNPKLNDKEDIQRVVFFGDSRAAEWPAPKIEGYEFVNRGVGGQTSAQTSQRFNYHLKDLGADIVVIQVGINDLKAIPIMSDHRNVIIDLCRGNIRQMVEDAKTLGATVIVTTIFPVGEVPIIRKPVWSDDIAQAIYEVNGYLDSLVDDQVIIFDGFSVLADEQGHMAEAYREDELHINSQGYAVLNQAFVEFFKTAKLPGNPETFEAAS